MEHFQGTRKLGFRPLRNAQPSCSGRHGYMQNLEPSVPFLKCMGTLGVAGRCLLGPLCVCGRQDGPEEAWEGGLWAC